MRLSSLAFVIYIASSCAHPHENRAPAAPQVDTTIGPRFGVNRFVSFPQVPDSTRIQHGSIQAASDAPPCLLKEIADTLSWSRVSTTIPSRYLKAVTFLLPPGFAGRSMSSPPQGVEDSDPSWQHILGSWSEYGGSGRMAPTRLALWIGSIQGYPSTGGGEDTRQVAYAECRLTTDVGAVPVALFTLQSPSPDLDGHYVAAYWEVRPGVYLSVLGRGPDSASQSRLVHALASVRVIP